jgi:hypothetical protein
MANYAESPSSGVWATQSADYTDVQDLKVSIAAQGGPVLVQLVATSLSGDFNGNIACAATAGGATCSFFRFTRDGTPLPSMEMGASVNAAAAGYGATVSLPCSVLSMIDKPTAGIHLYTLQARSANVSIAGGPHTTKIEGAKLVAIAF